MPNDTHSLHTEKLWDLIKDIRFAMFTTRHPNGHLHGCPMTLQNKSVDDGTLWFFMSRKGETVLELTRDAMVGVSFADPGKDTYVSLSATAQVMDDPAKARELWSKLNEAWFPAGVDDPNLALVKVELIHGHYWDVKESKLTQLMLMAKSAVTGEPPRLGESGEVRL